VGRMRPPCGGGVGALPCGKGGVVGWSASKQSRQHGKAYDGGSARSGSVSSTEKKQWGGERGRRGTAWGGAALAALAGPRARCCREKAATFQRAPLMGAASSCSAPTDLDGSRRGR